MPSANNTYVVAVSGGIDSVALLDALCLKRSIGGRNPWEGRVAGKLIVAHFDHGIRDDSDQDQVFVRQLALRYGCAYYSAREELGKGASEEKARLRRYAFLQKICDKHDAELVTAHHADDVVETIAINISRGTGWRGLAVMDNERIWRPLLNVTKQDIREYVVEQTLSWREDSTNDSDVYLRNRMRKRPVSSDVLWQTMALHSRQVELKHHIDNETRQLIGQSPYSRYFLTQCGDTAAIELLRTLFIQEAGDSPTIPVRMRALHDIKVARPGTSTHVSGGVSLRFTSTHFVVENSNKVLS